MKTHISTLQSEVLDRDFISVDKMSSQTILILLTFTNFVKFEIYKLFTTFGNGLKTDFTKFLKYVVNTFKYHLSISLANVFAIIFANLLCLRLAGKAS